MLCGLALCLSIHSEVIYTIARGYHEHAMNSDVCSRGGGGPYALGNPTLLFPHDAPQTPLTLQRHKLFGRMWGVDPLEDRHGAPTKSNRDQSSCLSMAMDTRWVVPNEPEGVW